MKIGIISRSNLNDKKVWSGTIYYISKAIQDNYEVEPIIIKDSLLKKIVKKIVKILLPKNRMIKLTSIFDKISLNRKIKIAINNGTNLFFVMAGSDLIASNGIPKECKLIYLSDATYHAMINYYYFDNEHDKKIGNQYEQISIDRADSIIYASEWAKDDAINYYKADKNKITVIPFPSYMDDCYKKKENLDVKETIHLLFVGVEWERKGTDIAIECVRYLNHSQKELKFDLTIIGLEKTNEKEYEEYISFKGRLYKDNPKDYRQLISYYQKSHIFILPTKAECAGIVFSEACMYGLPIFTHNTGGIGTYVKDGYNGVKLPLGSTGDDFGKEILKMINNKRFDKYSYNARNYYENNLSLEAWKNSFKFVVNNLK